MALCLAGLARSIEHATSIPSPYAASDAWRGDALFVPSGDDEDRINRSTRLFLEGRARWLVIAGSGAGGDSSEWLANKAIAMGVDPRGILLERRSTSTRENFVFSRPLLEANGIHSLLIVTNRSHARRAVLTAHDALPSMELHVLFADDDAPVTLGIRMRETMKTANQILRGHLPVGSTLWP